MRLNHLIGQKDFYYFLKRVMTKSGYHPILFKTDLNTNLNVERKPSLMLLDPNFFNKEYIIARQIFASLDTSITFEEKDSFLTCNEFILDGKTLSFEEVYEILNNYDFQYKEGYSINNKSINFLERIVNKLLLSAFYYCMNNGIPIKTKIIQQNGSQIDSSVVVSEDIVAQIKSIIYDLTYEQKLSYFGLNDLIWDDVDDIYLEIKKYIKNQKLEKKNET